MTPEIKSFLDDNYSDEEPIDSERYYITFGKLYRLQEAGLIPYGTSTLPPKDNMDNNFQGATIAPGNLLPLPLPPVKPEAPVKNTEPVFDGLMTQLTNGASAAPEPLSIEQEAALKESFEALQIQAAHGTAALVDAPLFYSIEGKSSATIEHLEKSGTLEVVTVEGQAAGKSVVSPKEKPPTPNIFLEFQAKSDLKERLIGFQKQVTAENRRTTEDERNRIEKCLRYVLGKSITRKQIRKLSKSRVFVPENWLKPKKPENTPNLRVLPFTQAEKEHAEEMIREQMNQAENPEIPMAPPVVESDIAPNALKGHLTGDAELDALVESNGITDFKSGSIEPVAVSEVDSE